MARHIYDEKGNYKGKVLTEKEHQDNTNSSLGCLLIFLVVLIFAIPVYMLYFSIFSMREKLEEAGIKETYWMSILASLMLLFSSTEESTPEKQMKLSTAKVFSWIVTILTLVTTYFLIVLFNQ